MRARKFILCRPEGGLTDMLCQIGRCYVYAAKFNRRLIIDCLNTRTFREPLNQYIEISDCHPYYVDENITDFLSKKGLSSIPVENVFPKVEIDYPPQTATYCMDRGYFHWNGIPLTFDFEKDYEEDFLIHHQCGGGMPAAFFLGKIRFISRISSAFFDRLSRLPISYSAYHCRNTDVQANLNEALESMRKLRGDIYVATDSFESLSFFRAMLPGRVINFSDIPNLDGKNIHDDFCDADTKRARNTDAFLDLLTLGMATWYGYSKNLQGCKSVSGYSLLAEFFWSHHFRHYLFSFQAGFVDILRLFFRIVVNSIKKNSTRSKFMKFPSRGRIAVWLGKKPGSSKYWGPPRRLVNSPCDLPISSCQRVVYLSQDETERHRLPNLGAYTQIQALLESGCANLKKTPFSLFSLDGARVLGSAFGHGVIGKGDYWIQNQCENYGLSAGLHPIRFNALLPRSKRLRGTSVCLSTRHSSNYYHWMFDVVARILKLKSISSAVRFDRYLVLDLHEPAFKIESLEYLGIDLSNVVNVRSGDHFECERLLLFERPLDAPVETETVRGIQNLIKPPELYKQQRFVYLSRENAKTRRIENENELKVGLEKMGFVSVMAEKLSFKEQVEVFQSAEVIVAPHGAGLANLIFCRKGTRVFEIFPTGYIRPDYAFISEKCGLEYFFILNGEEFDVDPENFTNSSPDAMRVDVAQVLETVHAGILGGEFPEGKSV